MTTRLIFPRSNNIINDKEPMIPFNRKYLANPISPIINTYNYKQQTELIAIPPLDRYFNVNFGTYQYNRNLSLHI